ncbi:hypothetical protein O181_074811 [Austropuccinia psidii MF-1]|uniref:TBP-associated factor 6 n=1 Tax=Austropuccinia psidii MF-1 TaxID=1389203 RepID=A0A9Q3F7A0_9BASI|nr:hypothetical protein [Austropuccinia psidii MF-1]
MPPAVPISTGVWPKTSVKDVAESLGLILFSDEAASVLASDVEYRLNQIIEDSIKFMRHSKRTTLLVEDVDHALRAKNIEPIWGFASTDTLSFRRTTSAVGNLYFIDDEEIDLTKIVNAQLPPVPRETSYTAHWLAVEGVQPAIPQNPSPAELKSHPAFRESSSTTNFLTSAPQTESKKIPTKQHLSRELRLYFDRVTSAAFSDDPGQKNAALASLSGDPGLHQLVPYLIQFVAERITATLSQTQLSLEQLRDSIRILESILSNPFSYLEPYLHQILPSILSCLLFSYPSSMSTMSELEREIRYSSGSLLSSQLNRYRHSYPTLRTRVLKTLTKSLIDRQSTDGNRLGAIIGVKFLGVEPTKVVLVQNIQAFGECLDLELDEGKMDEKTADKLVKETLKIMAEFYSSDSTNMMNTNKRQKKLRAIPAQDELEAEVGVQFAARLMASSDVEETRLAYGFIRQTLVSSNDEDDDSDEHDEEDDKKSDEISKMDVIPEENQILTVIDDKTLDTCKDEPIDLTIEPPSDLIKKSHVNDGPKEEKGEPNNNQLSETQDDKAQDSELAPEARSTTDSKNKSSSENAAEHNKEEKEQNNNGGDDCMILGSDDHLVD